MFAMHHSSLLQQKGAKDNGAHHNGVPDLGNYMHSTPEAENASQSHHQHHHESGHELPPEHTKRVSDGQDSKHHQSNIVFAHEAHGPGKVGLIREPVLISRDLASEVFGIVSDALSFSEQMIQCDIVGQRLSQYGTLMIVYAHAGGSGTSGPFNVAI